MQKIRDSQSYYGLKRAIESVQSVSQTQKNNGLIPKKQDNNDLTILPVYGIVLNQIFEQKPFHVAWQDLLATLEQFHDYLYRVKDRNNNGLIHTKLAETTSNISSNHEEDDKIREDNIQDVFYNALLVRSLRKEYEMNKKLYQITQREELLHKASLAKRRELKTTSAIFNELHNNEGFYNKYKQSFRTTKTFHSLAPIITGITNEKIQDAINLMKSDHFQPYHGYGITTTSMESGMFKPQTPWKGTVSPFVNYSLWLGLQEIDMEDARNLKSQTKTLIAEQFETTSGITPAKSLLEYKKEHELDNEQKLLSAIGWLHIKHKPRKDTWIRINETDKDRQTLAQTFNTPLFSTHYVPRETSQHIAGHPLDDGQDVTTASIFLDIT